MTAVLVTGMSGSGKTSVLCELARRGHRVIDTDAGGWIVDQRLPDGGSEPLWLEHRVTSLLEEPRDRPLFVAGCVANQGRFYNRFTAVVLLSAPEDVLLEHIATRTTNDFGKRSDERARILDDLRTVEPLLRGGATAEVDTRTPLAEVADMLESIAASTSS